MFFWIFLALSPVLLGHFFPKLANDARQRKVYYWLCGILLVAAIGLRHPTMAGTDTMNYYNFMGRAVASSSWFEFYTPGYFEPGFQLFGYLVSCVFPAEQGLLIVSAVIFIIAIFYFVDHNSKNIPLSLTCYICLGLMMFHLQGMRQSIAMSICLFAYEQAKYQKLRNFVLLVALACAIHQTAIVFLPVYVLCQMKFSFRNIILILIGALLALFFAKGIITKANEVFNRSYNHTVDSGGFVATAIYFMTLAVALIYYAYHRTDKTVALMYILMTGACCYVMRYVGTLAAERISFYFAFAQLALIPQAIHVLPRKYMLVITGSVIVLAVALMAYRYSGTAFVPYRFFWQSMPIS